MHGVDRWRSERVPRHNGCPSKSAFSVGAKARLVGVLSFRVHLDQVLGNPWTKRAHLNIAAIAQLSRFGDGQL